MNLVFFGTGAKLGLEHCLRVWVFGSCEVVWHLSLQLRPLDPIFQILNEIRLVGPAVQLIEVFVV